MLHRISITRRIAWESVMLGLMASASCNRSAPVAQMTEPVAEAGTFAQAKSAGVAPRKVIETGELRVEVDDVSRAVKAADSIVSGFQGITSASRSFQGDNGHTETSLTLRIPVARFRDAVVQLRALGKVRNENLNSQDVTREYADLEIRLGVKRDLVNRLRGLLTGRAAKLSEILEVERELARAVAELEVMEGERRFMDNQVAMSTLQVSFFHAPLAAAGSFLDPVNSSIREASNVLGASVGTAITVIVFVLPWSLLALAIWGIRRRLALRKAASGPSTPKN